MLLSTSNVRMSEGTFCRFEVHIIQLVRVIFLISMPQKVNFTGINMFKRYIVDFSKNLENSDFFLKSVKNL